MRLAGKAMMLAGMAMLVVVAISATVMFLHFPVPYLQVKPLKPSERLPSLSDVRADSPERPPPSAQQVARMQSDFGSMCRTSVRSESERRKLGFPRERVNALCDCLVQNAIDTRFAFDEREGFKNSPLIIARDTAPERKALDDARYRTIIADAERACAAR
jgi:hypothetical protein